MSFRVMLAQFRPSKGDYRGSLRRLGEIFRQIGRMERRPDVLVLPEAALTGYFLEGGVREQARTAGEVLADLQAIYTEVFGEGDAGSLPPLDIVVGFYERWRDRFYNSALYATLGAGEGLEPGLRHVHRKVFLPTYGVFDEARFVESGHHIAAFDTRFGRAAMLICEDAWHSISPTIAALDGAQVLYIVSASPARGPAGERPTNLERWEDMVHDIASEHGIYVVLCQLVGFEGGKGFAGGSVVVGPRADVRARAPLWDEVLLEAEIDLHDLPLARADLPLLADLEEKLPYVLEELRAAGRGEPRHVTWDDYAKEGARHISPNGRQISGAALGVAGGAVSAGTQTPVSSGPMIAHTTGNGVIPVFSPPPFNPQSDDPLRINAPMVAEWLVRFLREEVSYRRGFKRVVVGLSGGVDSALTTYLCVRAFGPEHVLALRMPYKTSSPESLEHAQIVIDDLGIPSETIDITRAVDGYLDLAPDADARRRGNVMARMRMIVLFDYSAKIGGIPIGTGNKTERLFGYFTWHADDSPPVNPLGDLFKTQVWQLARYVGVPDVIVEKPASADLIRGQTDEADFGVSYPQADRILAYLLQGYSAERLVELGFAAHEVQLVLRRLNSTHWKRHLPSVAMLTSTAIGEYYLRPVDY
ncbi:MAG: hypothetical protein KatS3mg057_2300 [Herpetosiphonaceae bacterium]|nr:MAG: hypothetical protein KatS3mg057_2300 [Herpetosiphonaceae bacterium]